MLSSCHSRLPIFARHLSVILLLFYLTFFSFSMLFFLSSFFTFQSLFFAFFRALTSLISCRQGTQCTGYRFRDPSILSWPRKSSGCDRWNVRNNYRKQEAFQPHGETIQPAFCASPSNCTQTRALPPNHHPERQKQCRYTGKMLNAWGLTGEEGQFCNENHLNLHLDSSSVLTRYSHLCASKTNVPPSGAVFI